MGAKLIIRVTPDDNVEVKVEGLTEPDRPKPKGQKLCEKVTRVIEQDLGVVDGRDYAEDAVGDFGVLDEEQLRLGEN